MDLKKINKVLYGISIFIAIIGLIYGIYISLNIIVEVNNWPDSFLKVLITNMALPAIIIVVIIVCVVVSLAIDVIIWGIYGIILLISKLIKQKRWKILIIPSMSIVVTILIVLGINVILEPRLEENTIGFIAYDYNPDLDNSIYIKENNEYITYLVLTYNYNNTKNALCLRKNVVGGQNGYIEDYNGTISKNIVYNNWIKMQNNVRYEETNVDKYLTGDFLNRFNSELLNKICNTHLNVSNYENGEYNSYVLDRQFFILSFTELDESGSSYDNQSKKLKLKYFNKNSKNATNDVGVQSPYWTRTPYYNSSYYFVGYTGEITYTGSHARFGVRPAFTISNDTKVNKIYDEILMKDIYVLE